MAVVVEAKSADVTWDIADRLGRPLSCFDGAARIYWPGFSIDDTPRRHPLYLASRVAAFGAGAISLAIQRSIFSVATFRFVSDPRMNAIVRAREEIERIEKLSNQKSDTNTDWEKFALDLDEELSKAKGRLTELEAENENLRANQKFVFSVEPEADANVSQPSREPVSNLEATEFAKLDCENLLILDSAMEAAAECPFKRPQEIYDALRDLDDIASRLKNEANGDLRQQLIEKGWGKRCSMFISDTTKRRYGNSYKFEYGNERRLFEPHITLGSGDPNTCASIHFILDGQKIVVAHAGRHLPNTKT